jgi:hypothetical protein
MTKIRTGQAAAQLSRIRFHDRFTQSFKDPLFAPEEAALSRLEDVAWKAYKDDRKAPVTQKAGKGYVGYYEPYATSHDALDRDKDVQEEVRNVARAVVNAVREARAGRLSTPDAKLDSPRPK